MNRFHKYLLSGLVLAGAATLTTSCSMMEEDRDDCPSGLYVRFVYDYNTARADMFKDHVGHVALYVYDENGRKVAERTVSNTASEAPLSRYGYAIHFADGELPDGKYRLQAVAMQRDWDEALKTSGAKYRRPSPERAEDLVVKLDHANTQHPELLTYAVSADAPLDTLWHTLRVTSTEPMDGKTAAELHPTRKPYSVYPLADQYVEVKHEMVTYATMSMIRDTKHINLILRQLDFPEDVDWRDYEVFITDRNCTLGHDNELLEPTHNLRYEPYRSWNTSLTDGGIVTDGPRRAEGDLRRAAHFNLMTNRIMYRGTDGSDVSHLIVRNRNTGRTVADLNLAAVLSEGRAAFETFNYPVQEYLDREYDYKLYIWLKGESWRYVDVVVDVLSWSKRIQRVDL